MSAEHLVWGWLSDTPITDEIKTNVQNSKKVGDGCLINKFIH